MKRKLMIVCIVFSMFGLVVAGEASPPSPSSPPFPVEIPGGGVSLPFSAQTLWGEMGLLGDGEIQAFVTVSPEGRLKNVGVYFSAGLLENLPTDESDGHWDVKDEAGNVVLPCCGHEVVLGFPDGVEGNPFKHFVLNWNPDGHGPPGIYTLPHFDFHFYTITNDERTAIKSAPSFDQACWVPNMPEGPFCMNSPNTEVCHPIPVTCDTFLTGTEPLPDEEVPPGYVSGVAVEPGMGNHLSDLTSPEFQGETFTKTWIYGTFGGKVTFFEPMITEEVFKEAKWRSSMSFPTPDRFSEEGWYPTQYSIYYLKGLDAYIVALERMSFFEGRS